MEETGSLSVGLCRQTGTAAPWADGSLKETDRWIEKTFWEESWTVATDFERAGIVEDADTVDGAMIFGTGYAPFRGGPLNYARTRGPENVVAALRTLAAKFGGRFNPDAGWDTFK